MIPRLFAMSKELYSVIIIKDVLALHKMCAAAYSESAERTCALLKKLPTSPHAFDANIVVVSQKPWIQKPILS